MNSNRVRIGLGMAGRRNRFIPLVVFLGITLLTPAALLGATWREGSRVIVSLDEFMVQLESAKSSPLASDLPGDTPLLMGRDFTGFTPQFLNKALFQNSLMTQPGSRGLTMVRSGQFAERPTTQNREHIKKLATPGPQKSGAIPSGGAVLFGHLVEPPFVVETNGQHVLVNGLPVYPSPGIPREPAVITARVTNQHDLLTGARETYNRNLVELGAERARQNLKDSLANHPLVEDAEWTHEVELTIRWRAGDELIMSFQERGRDPDPRSAEHEAEVLELLVTALRDCLERGHTVVAGADYFRTVTDTPASELLPRIREILALPESEELKRCRLQARTEGSRTALDILAEN